MKNLYHWVYHIMKQKFADDSNSAASAGRGIAPGAAISAWCRGSRILGLIIVYYSGFTYNYYIMCRLFMTSMINSIIPWLIKLIHNDS